MNKTAKWIVGAVIVLVVIVWGYSASVQNKLVSSGPIKIGAILPLTGEMASYGEGWRNAILMALENSGLKDKVQLIVEDDGSCVITQDVTIAQKLVGIDKVKAIIGPACSSSFLSTIPVTEKGKVVAISSSATSKAISGAGNYAFRTIASDSDKAILVADFAYDHGYRKAAMLYDITNDAYLQQRDDVKAEFTKKGGQIVVDQSMKKGDTDFRSQLTKIKNSDADVIFVGFFPSKEGSLVLKQAKELGIKLQVISSTPEIGTPDFIAIAGDLSEGLIFPFADTPSNKEYSDFLASYKAKFGKDSVTYGAETYDATMLLVNALVKSDGTADGIKNELLQLGQNYNGASGVISFKKNGDVEKPIMIEVVKNGVPVPYNQ